MRGVLYFITMAENKKSFILYSDLLHTIDLMPDENAGKLFKHILKYVNDLNPEAEDLITKLSFEPIKQQLKRDLIKWEDKSVNRSESGRLGGIKSGEARRSKMKQNEANALKSKQNEHVTVNVNVNDNVNVNNIEERKLKFADTLKPYLQTYGKDFLNDFFKYWTEPNVSNTKFKKELERTWSLDRRLEMWSRNEKNFNPKQEPKTQSYLKEF
jgi:hypothetical protein